MRIDGLERFAGLTEEEREYMGKVIIQQIQAHSYEDVVGLTEIELYITKRDGFIKVFKGKGVIDEMIEGSYRRLCDMKRKKGSGDDWVYKVCFTDEGVVCTRLDYSFFKAIASKKPKSLSYLLKSKDKEMRMQVRDWEVKGVPRAELASMVEYTYKKRTGSTGCFGGVEKTIINLK